ncbi:hypothetical protein ABK040_006476 [Willaertia magna]
MNEDPEEATTVSNREDTSKAMNELLDKSIDKKRNNLLKISSDFMKQTNKNNSLNDTVLKEIFNMINNQESLQNTLSSSVNAFHKVERLNQHYQKSVTYLLDQMGKFEESKQEEISTLKKSYEQKLVALESELQRKDILIEVLSKVNNEKDKVIDQLQMKNNINEKSLVNLNLSKKIRKAPTYIPKPNEKLSPVGKKKPRQTNGGYVVKDLDFLQEYMNSPKNCQQDTTTPRSTKDSPSRHSIGVQTNIPIIIPPASSVDKENYSWKEHLKLPNIKKTPFT